MAAPVHAFTRAAISDTLARLGTPDAPRFTDEAAVLAHARSRGLSQIVTPYAPTGPVASRLTTLARLAPAQGITVARVLRDHDRDAWPHATYGFFRFRQAVTG
mgnify:FL=1